MEVVHPLCHSCFEEKNVSSPLACKHSVMWGDSSWKHHESMSRILLNHSCRSIRKLFIRHSECYTSVIGIYICTRLVFWCFAYDRQNYAKYLWIYNSQMTGLPEEHPEIYKYFRGGGFSVQISKEPLLVEYCWRNYWNYWRNH